MDEKRSGWDRFQRLSINRKTLSKRARRAETTTIRHARKFVSKRINNIYDVRRHVVLWLVGVAMLIVVVGVQQMWFRDSYMQTAPVSGGTYAEGVLGQINTLNPLYATSEPEQALARLMFSSLLQYDTTGNLGNELASGYRVEDGGKRYVVSLRDGARWHDGTALSVKDVLFTIELMKNPATRSQYEAQWRGVTVEQVGDRDIAFTLPAVYAAFPHILTFPVLPEHVLRDVEPTKLRESAFSLSPVGSGPFVYRLNQPESNRRIVNMTAFKDYFKGAPKLARFELHAYENRDDIKKALQVGQVTATTELYSDKDLVGKNKFITRPSPLNAGVYAFYNMTQPALKDKSVRRALSVAVDGTKLRKSVGADYSLQGPFVAGQVPGVGDIAQLPYDKVAAAALLDKAGWKLDGETRKKDGQPLILRVATTNDPMFEASAQLLADNWKELGIETDVTVINPNDPSQDFTQNIVQPRAYDVLIHEITIGSDPDVYAFWHSSQANSRGLNLSMYSSGLSDDALSSARARVEPELRAAKYLAFAKQWSEDMPALGLFQSQIMYIGYDQTASITPKQHLVSAVDRYANVIDWSAETAQVYKTP